MAYASLSDVQELIAQFTITSVSTPAMLQVQAIIDDISNEVDVTLAGAGFSVPVTTPTYFADWLGRLNAYGSAAAVLKSMFPDAAGAGDTPAYAFWEERYQNGLAGIKDGSMVPPEAISGEGLIQPSTYLTCNPDEEESLGDIAEPMFKIGTRF